MKMEIDCVWQKDISFLFIIYLKKHMTYVIYCQYAINVYVPD
jgi:hypothetical protein